MDVKVYSNQNEVTLFSNGKEIGTQSGSKIFIFKDVLLEYGNNTIKAIGSSGSSDTVIFTRVKEPVPGYIMPEDPDDKEDGVKNWFDDLDVNAPIPEFTFDDGFFCINDKIKDICENEEAGMRGINQEIEAWGCVHPLCSAKRYHCSYLHCSKDNIDLPGYGNITGI